MHERISIGNSWPHETTLVSWVIKILNFFICVSWLQLKVHLNSFKKHAKLSLQLLNLKKKIYFLCCRSFPSSFFINMTPLSEVLVHFTSLKAHTSPTCKELSCTNFLQPVEKFVLVAPIMYLIDQVLPSKTERVTLVFLVRKYLSKKWNGTVYI